MKSIFIRTSIRASLFALLLAAPLVMRAQLVQQLASNELPDAPLPQATQPSTQQGTSSSNPTPDSQPAPSQPPATSTAPQAQSQSPAQSQPPAQEDKHKTAEQQLEQELHQRMAGVVPNFNAVLTGDAVPLSPSQKMRAAFRSAVDPYQFGLAVITSLYGQATDSHSSYDATRMINVGYSQGFVGYLQRYGASFTDQFDGTIIGNGLFPVILHQDARYYRMGTGPFMKRFIYSIGTTVRCKGDNGKWQPNYSNVLGNVAAGGISNLYYPAAERGFGLTMEQAATVTAEGSFGALLIEFYPDIRKHIHGKRRPADPTVQSTTPAPKNQ